MTDEERRKLCEALRSGSWGESPSRETCDEAANEIERLEKLVLKLNGMIVLQEFARKLRTRAADKSAPSGATGWPLPETPEHIRRFAEKLRARAADRSAK